MADGAAQSLRESRYSTGFGDWTVPSHTIRTPSYRLHNHSGQAVVPIDGQDFSLGKYDTAESRVEYDRLIAEWLMLGRRLPDRLQPAEADTTVNELLLAYLNWA